MGDWDWAPAADCAGGIEAFAGAAFIRRHRLMKQGMDQNRTIYQFNNYAYGYLDIG